MVFPEYNEYYIKLGYIIQMLAYYVYCVSPKSQSKNAIVKFLKRIKSSKLIKSYDLKFNIDIKLCDVKVTINEKNLEFRFDFSKNIREGLTFINGSNIYFLDPTLTNYKEM